MIKEEITLALKKPKEKNTHAELTAKEPPKARKGRTLTGKKAGLVEIKPHLNLVDGQGRALKESVAVVGWGRMNPPTIGHERVVEEINRIATENSGVPLLFLSATNGKKNPLTISEKYDLVEEAFGDKVLVIKEELTNPFDMLKAVAETFDNIIWVTGSDQLEDYTRIIEGYNGKEFEFKTAKVVSAGDRSEASSMYIESISASILRKAVNESDITTFTRGLPTKLQPRALEIYEQVKFGQTIVESKQSKQSDILSKIAQERFKH